MTGATLIFLTIALIFGLIISHALLKKRPASTGMVAIHGFAGFTAITIFTIYTLSNPFTINIIGLIILGFSTLLGVLLVFKNPGKRSGPMWVVLVHALLAMLATGIILVAYID